MISFSAFVPQTVESVGHQKAYESKLIVRQFWGIISMFIVSLLAKFLFQYRFGYSYYEFVMNIDISLFKGSLILFAAIFTIINTMGFGLRSVKYELAIAKGSEWLTDKELAKVKSDKELLKMKVWYYIHDMSDCFIWGIALSIFPPVPFYVSYITGAVLAFFATLEGYYHKDTYAGISDLGWGLSIGSGTLLIANICLNLHWYDNVLAIVCIIASIFVIVDTISENDVWEKIQTNCPELSLIEQERVLEGYCYSKSSDIVFHSRNIIGQLMCLLSDDD